MSSTESDSNMSQGDADATVPPAAADSDESEAATVRHNLRNTLYSIVLHVQGTRHHLDHDDVPAAYKNLDGIDQAVREAEELVNRLGRTNRS